ncbi:hypothetical protein RHMOL_Rhmol03G0160500 [Rhododendron molle]|uniref:Uncharacterized protein n=1 Tax=Rhododendron molle TaxID=49168 RepID=A0ACC0PF12_RHOML|nr:hypothetical protein RHMOL_Rhmol03G0160500 [Rhododendron molle]
MGDGTISMADGVGIKAVDSNELRRKIRGPTPTHQNLGTSKTISLGSAVVDGSVTPLNIPPVKFGSIPNHSSELPSIYPTSEHSESLKLNVLGNLNLGSTVRSAVPSVTPTEFGEFSPKSATKSSPSRKLQQVVALACARLADVTIPVVAVVDTTIPTVSEGFIYESESEGEELNVSPDIPLEVKVAAGALSSSGEVYSVSPPLEPDSVATGVVPSQHVLIVKPVPLDDKAETVQGNLTLESPQELKSHKEQHLRTLGSLQASKFQLESPFEL